MHTRVFVVLLASAASLTVPLAAVQLRSILNFSDMIKTATGRNSQDYNEYGNWCGKGGQGNPVDDVDRCCLAHDRCYDRIVLHKCKGSQNMLPYLKSYKWAAKNGKVLCQEQDDECAKVLCECDKIAVTCFAKSKYNPKNKH